MGSIESTKFTNETLQDAVELWRNDEPTCLQKHCHITHWDTSQVTDMHEMFSNATSINQPLNWDTSQVTNMHGMFCGAALFNQPLEWDPSQVTDMGNMFSESATEKIYKIDSLRNLDAMHPYFNRVRRHSLAIAEVVANHGRASCQWSNDVAQTLGLVGEIGQFV